MAAIDHEIIRHILLGTEDPKIRYQFIERYEQKLETFVAHMDVAFSDWENLDSELSKNIHGAHVSALIYGALNTHLVAMKLLISGLFVPAGNSQRYVLESLATALLTSKPELGFLARYSDGKYSTSKSIRDVLRHAEALGLDRKALEMLSIQAKLYDRSSHPTLFSLASIVTFEEASSKIVVGGCFDEGKSFAYEKEINSRTSLASIFPNIVFAIRRNYFGQLT
jgi:hypothetical protein